MRELRLYSRAFNRDEKIHYLFDTDTRYLSELSTYLLFTIPFNDYRINNGQIMVAPKYVNVAGVETEVTLADLSKVCYAADVEYDENSNIVRAVYYFVRRCFDQSGNMILGVERDLWASSLLKASFGAFHITRSNRKIPNYVLPDVDATYDYYPPQELGAKINKSNVSVLLVLTYGLEKSLFSADVSKNVVLAIPLSHIYDLIHGVAPEYDTRSIVEKAVDLIGGVNSVTWLSGAFSSSAAVIKAWIVPNEALPANGLTLQGVYSIKARSPMTKGTDVDITDFKAIPPNVFIKTIDVESAYLAQSGTRLPLGDYVEVGTLGNSMPFRRGEDFTYAFYKYVIDTNGLSVCVEQGTYYKDITEAFEISVSLNGATETSLQKGTSLLQKLTSSAIGLGANLLIGNVGGAIATGVGATTSLIRDTTAQGVNRASTMGNGGVTFDYSYDEVNCPYVARVWYRSTDYEGMLMYSGAPCDLFANYTYIKVVPTLEYLDETLRPIPQAVIACDYIEVNGLNMEEEKYIKDEFARGIKIAYII